MQNDPWYGMNQLDEWIPKSKAIRRQLEKELIQLAEYVSSEKMQSVSEEERTMKQGKLFMKLAELKCHAASVKTQELEFIRDFEAPCASRPLEAMYEMVDTMGACFGSKCSQSNTHLAVLAKSMVDDTQDFLEWEASLVGIESERAAEFLSLLTLYRFSKIPHSEVSRRMQFLRESNDCGRLNEPDRDTAVRMIYADNDDHDPILSRLQWLLMRVYFELNQTPFPPLAEYFVAGLTAMNLPSHERCGICGVCYFNDHSRVPLAYFQKSRSVLLDRVSDTGGACLVDNDEIYPADSTVRKVFLDL